MNPIQKQVLEFHKKYDHYIGRSPSREIGLFRVALVTEEATELVSAIMRGNLVDIADAIADLLYVTFGTAVVYGLDMEPICDEVHRSNMTKRGGKNLSGKTVKGEEWEPPRLERLVMNEQDTSGNQVSE